MLAQCLVTTARLVILDAPVAAIQSCIDLRVDMAVMETGLNACGLELRKNRLRQWSCRLPSAARKPSTNCV